MDEVKLEKMNVISALQELIRMVNESDEEDFEDLMDKQLCVNKLMDYWESTNEKSGTYRVMSLKLSIQRRPIR